MAYQWFGPVPDVQGRTYLHKHPDRQKTVVDVVEVVDAVNIGNIGNIGNIADVVSMVSVKIPAVVWISQRLPSLYGRTLLRS